MYYILTPYNTLVKKIFRNIYNAYYLRSILYKYIKFFNNYYNLPVKFDIFYIFKGILIKKGIIVKWENAHFAVSNSGMIGIVV